MAVDQSSVPGIAQNVGMREFGIVTAETLRLFVIGLPAVAIGTWLGLKLYGKLDEALVLLLFSGLTLLPVAWMRGS